jgi:hypothetical protein
MAMVVSPIPSSQNLSSQLTVCLHVTALRFVRFASTIQSDVAALSAAVQCDAVPSAAAPSDVAPSDAALSVVIQFPYPATLNRLDLAQCDTATHIPTLWPQSCHLTTRMLLCKV